MPLREGWTPLHEACNYGNYSIAQELIKAGANINARATGNTTPLHGKNSLLQSTHNNRKKTQISIVKKK